MTDKSKQVDEMLQLLGQELSEARFHERMVQIRSRKTHRTPVAPKTSRKTTEANSESMLPHTMRACWSNDRNNGFIRSIPYESIWFFL